MSQTKTIILGSNQYEGSITALSPQKTWKLSLVATNAVSSERIPSSNPTTMITYSISIQSQDAAKLRVPSTDYLYNVTKEALFQDGSLSTVSYGFFFVSGSDVGIAQNVKVKTLQEAQTPKDILVIKLNVMDRFGDQVYWLPLKPSSAVVEPVYSQDSLSPPSLKVGPNSARSITSNLTTNSELADWQVSSSQFSPKDMHKKIVDLEIEVMSLKNYIATLRRVDEEQSDLIQQQNDQIASLQVDVQTVVALVEQLGQEKRDKIDEQKMAARVRAAAKARGVGMLVGSPKSPQVETPSRISPRSSKLEMGTTTTSTGNRFELSRTQSSPTPVLHHSPISTKRHSPSPHRQRGAALSRQSSKATLQMSVPGRLSSPSRRGQGSPRLHSPSTPNPKRATRSSPRSRTSSKTQPLSSGSSLSSPSHSARSPSDPTGPLFDDTVLLQSLQQQRTLSKYYGNKTQQWTLIYRGSQDGFGSRDFHRCVDGQGPTLTVVQDASTQACLFGGFMSRSWHNKGRYIVANGCWLFSLRRPQGDEDAVKIPCTDNKVAAMGHKDKGPTFGLGCDLFISDNCNLNNESYSHLGESYQNAYIHQDIDSKSLVREFFCGAFKFRVAEVEVFTLASEGRDESVGNSSIASSERDGPQ
mmetsp:Transcript_1620/g.5594  ORF Transcript_1620/g.5594 Transcript_1620/m.5594 type:complete len:641 (-) Transcript_1620:530-2452(-)|eukprot:CAMPEP_0117436126 /NCGR_PEP_ID=MMETSP0759-20121206/846_1 /TAXON_ID=63605 /ORGANISM="Percolomonas cosmopolitus, Strain WS" /LENGTH=640 /DNA_ID=CAMNT_0005227715 /DNA_START=3775 /DNA_END=5697 /DNA_ORIENTATION=+